MKSNIRLLRKKMGLTQKELGDMIGVSQQVVSRMEQEREAISVDVLVSLAEYFRVSTDYVLNYQDCDKRAGTMVSSAAANIGKEEVLTLIQRTDHICNRDWLLIWSLINAMMKNRP